MEIVLKCSDYSKKVNFKEGLKSICDLSLGTALTEILSVKATKEMKAFLLLFKTFNKTNHDLKIKLDSDKINSSKNSLALSAEFERKIKLYFEQEIVITKEFFIDVIKYSPDYLIQSFKIFKENINLLEIDLPENYEYDYYTTYRRNLEEEFQENKDFYDELVAYFDNPIFEQNQGLAKQLEYYKSIKSFYTNPLQPDVEECKESLRDLYIEPFFEIYKNNFNKDSILEEDQFRGDFLYPIEDISIHDFLKDYFLEGKEHNTLNSKYNMLFLLGQPGQGKTSFCYKLIYDYLQKNNGLPKTPIYFVKIRELAAKDFVDSTFSTINKHLNQNISFESDSCILLLDGLDEAYMAGGLNDKDLKIIYDRLNKTSQNNKLLKIILTSRLNYLKVNDSCVDKSLVCQLSVLTDNQIIDYTEKFKKFYPKNKFLKKIDKVLEEDKYNHVKELLQQAVLIYFIAISDIDIDNKDSKANIYDKIFESLAKRSWEKQRGQLDYLNGKVKNDYKQYEKYLRAYIRNIAFEIYQAPYLFITLDKLSELEATKKFTKKCFNEDLLTSKENIKEINKYLLISFYFQESSSNITTETAIEFFHNSLWQYLTAEYMWEENKKMLLKEDEEGEIEIVSMDEYFNMLNRLTGQKHLDNEVINNLENIIENDSNENKRIVLDQSIKIFYKLSNKDFLLKYSSLDCRLTAFEKANSVFELFWSFINFSKFNFDDVIKSNSTINYFLFHKLSFNTFFKLKNFDFVSSQYIGSFFGFEFGKVNFNNFSSPKHIINTIFLDCIFENSHFYHCTIQETTFENVIFSMSSLGKSCSVVNVVIKKVKFLNFEIPSKDWFEILCDENVVDDFTKKNHEVRKYITNYHDGTEIEQFYLHFIEEHNDLKDDVSAK